MRQCSNCGFFIKEDMPFCSNCGQPTVPINYMPNNNSYNYKPYTNTNKDSGVTFLIIILITFTICVFTSIALLRVVLLDNEAKNYSENGVYVFTYEELYYNHNKNSVSDIKFFYETHHSVKDTYIDYIRGEIWLEVEVWIKDENTKKGEFKYYWVVKEGD